MSKDFSFDNFFKINVQKWGTGENDCLSRVAQTSLNNAGKTEDAGQWTKIKEQQDKIQEYNNKIEGHKIENADVVYEGQEILIPIEDAIEGIKNDFETTTSEYDEQQQEIADCTDKLTSANSNVSNTKASYDQALTEYNKAKSAASNSGDSNQNSSAIDSLKATLDAKKEEYTKAVEEQKEAQEALKEAQEKAKETKEKIEKLEKELDEYTDRKDEKEKEIDDQLKEIAGNIEGLEDELTQAQEELDKMKQELEQMKSGDRDEGENWDTIDKNAKKALSTSNTDQKIAKADGVEVSDEEENPNYFEIKQLYGKIIEDEDNDTVIARRYTYDEDGNEIIISEDEYKNNPNEYGTSIDKDNLISETTYEYPSSDVQVEIVKTKDEDGEDTYEVNVKDGQLTPELIDKYADKYSVDISPINTSNADSTESKVYNILNDSSSNTKNSDLKDYFNNNYSLPDVTKSTSADEASPNAVKDALYSLDITNSSDDEIAYAVGKLTSTYGTFDNMINVMMNAAGSGDWSDLQNSIYLTRVAQLMERYNDIKKD